MSLKVGIVGLPNVGKSTLFNALTKKQVDAENYPFCTIEPSVGTVAVPDKRIDELAEMSQTQKTIYATVEFVDIAGLVKGASDGEGLGNKFLSNIRETDAIFQVVRVFEDDDIIHVDGKVDPLFDIEIINMELIQADLQVLRKRRESNQKDLKRGDNEAKKLDEVLSISEKILTEGKLISQFLNDFSEEQKVELKKMQFLTAKPFMYILNKDTSGRNIDQINDSRWEDLVKYFRENSFEYISIDAKNEMAISEFPEDEKQIIREEEMKGVDGLDVLIKKGYEILNLISYFTTGEKETRAWTIKINTKAPQAAAAIHNDFEKKFIRAQVIDWELLVSLGSKSAAKEKGLLRMEGKDYIVKDGDVIEFFI